MPIQLVPQCYICNMSPHAMAEAEGRDRRRLRLCYARLRLDRYLLLIIKSCIRLRPKCYASYEVPKENAKHGILVATVDEIRRHRYPCFHECANLSGCTSLL